MDEGDGDDDEHAETQRGDRRERAGPRPRERREPVPERDPNALARDPGDDAHEEPGRAGEHRRGDGHPGRESRRRRCAEPDCT